jgi:hypothetical protein
VSCLVRNAPISSCTDNVTPTAGRRGTVRGAAWAVAGTSGAARARQANKIRVLAMPTLWRGEDPELQPTER